MVRLFTYSLIIVGLTLPGCATTTIDELTNLDDASAKPISFKIFEITDVNLARIRPPDSVVIYLEEMELSGWIRSKESTDLILFGGDSILYDSIKQIDVYKHESNIPKPLDKIILTIFMLVPAALIYGMATDFTL